MRTAEWGKCSDPPGESCSDPGCPLHGWDDDPPEYDPDDAEAQRIAETCADANREYDRIENEDRQ